MLDTSRLTSAEAEVLAYVLDAGILFYATDAVWMLFQARELRAELR